MIRIRKTTTRKW